MANCTVSGTLVDSSANPVSGSTISFRVSKPVLDAANNLVLPVVVSTTSASNGTWSLILDQGISGLLTIDYAPTTTSASRRDVYSLIIPAASTATFASLYPTET